MARKGMTTPWACREGSPPPAWVFPPSSYPPRVAETPTSRGFVPQILHGTSPLVTPRVARAAPYDLLDGLRDDNADLHYKVPLREKRWARSSRY